MNTTYMSPAVSIDQMAHSHSQFKRTLKRPCQLGMVKQSESTNSKKPIKPCSESVCLFCSFIYCFEVYIPYMIKGVKYMVTEGD